MMIVLFSFFGAVIGTCFCLVMYILLEKPLFVMDTTWVFFLVRVQLFSCAFLTSDLFVNVI